MTKILKFGEYMDWDQISREFLTQMNTPIISESDENSEGLDGYIKNILDKFGFNLELVFTFGSGVKFMFPIVNSLITNMKLEITPSTEDIVLLCITIIAIMYLQNRKQPLISADDIKNKLNPEIQMKFGNPRILVNKLLECFNQIYNFIKKFPKLFGVALGSLLDMFSYTSILIPVMNAIASFCSKYEVTPDNLLGNLLSLGVGIMTISSKELLNYVKNKVSKSKQIDTTEVPTEVDEFDLGDNKLIQEQ